MRPRRCLTADSGRLFFEWRLDGRYRREQVGRVFEVTKQAAATMSNGGLCRIKALRLVPTSVQRYPVRHRLCFPMTTRRGIAAPPKLSLPLSDPLAFGASWELQCPGVQLGIEF
jgi:hypothetical protein